MHLTILVRAAIVLLAVVLSACSTGPNPIFQTLQQVVKWDENAATAYLNPNFLYLRVVVDGRVVFLALGNEDLDPRGPIEVWFSAEREVLRFQKGRLVGAVGLPAEWRHVSFPGSLPSWHAIAQSGQPVLLTRVRDVMPGYLFGVRDDLVLRVISPPNKNELRDVDPQSLTWFEEQVDPEQSTGSLMVGASHIIGKTLPPARYAVDLRGDKETVVYGEQCLATDLCFSWQRWPAAIQAAGK